SPPSRDPTGERAEHQRPVADRAAGGVGRQDRRDQRARDAHGVRRGEAQRGQPGIASGEIDRPRRGRDDLDRSPGAGDLAGASGLDRVVQRLNVMEVPDILPWVKPHELLLTTGYPLRDAPDALVDLVAELDERGLAAMAIKLHRYIDALPPQMLAEADRR